MATSITSAIYLDAGDFGREQSQLPPWEQGPIDLRTFFHFPPAAEGQPRPLEIEIGSGKGTFLIQEAPLHPDTDFLGIEYAKPYWRHAADRLRRHGVVNARALHAEAAFFLRNYLPAGSVRQVHIYFPDPWPKAKQNKRRLVQAPFLRELHRLLTPDGRVRMATDHEGYFHWMEEHAAIVCGEGLFERLPFERPASAGEGELVGSNFERKYREEGRQFFSGLILQRQPILSA